MYKLISVIVPVYNTELYLRDCLDSIIQQTYDDFELILVNDGSTDKSFDIMSEYADKDNRIRIFNKQNGGQSSARNLGLDNAKGDYISFVDSDDIIAPNYLKNMYESLSKTGLRVAQMSLKDFENKIESFDEKIEFEDIVDFDKCYDTIKYTDYYNDSFCSKFFHKSIFENLRFYENEIFEDSKIILQMWLASEKQVNIGYAGYYYRKVLNSTTRKYNPQKDFEIIDVWEKRRENYISLNFKNHIEEIDKRIFNIVVNQFYNAKCHNASKEILSHLKSKIQKYLAQVKKNKFVYGRLKLIVKLCTISPEFYVFVQNSYNKLKK